MNYDKDNISRSAIGRGLQMGATGLATAGPIGGAIGLVGGAVTGLLSERKRQKDEEEAMQKRKEVQDSIRLASYPTSGVSSGNTYYGYGGIKYYKYGGMKKRYANGSVQPIGSSGAIAKGPSHAQGGIGLPGNVEVEGEETMHQDGEKEIWFSNRLKTSNGKKFSDAAEELLYKKEELEAKLHSRSKAVRNTAMREIEKVNLQLDELTNEQISVQESKGIDPSGEEDALGVKRAANGASFSRLIPHLDNVANIGATLATPEVPKPELEERVDLDTEYNVDDIVGAERRGLSNLRKGIERNVSSGAVSRANMLASHASSMERMNEVMGDKERMETNLENKQALANQAVDQRNLERTNRYKLQQAARKDEMLTNLSAITANSIDDFVTQEEEDRLKRRDTVGLELLKAKYKSLGIWDRTMENGLAKYMRGDITYDQFKAMQNKKLSVPKTLPTRAGSIMSKPRKLNQ